MACGINYACIGVVNSFMCGSVIADSRSLALAEERREQALSQLKDLWPLQRFVAFVDGCTVARGLVASMIILARTSLLTLWTFRVPVTMAAIYF